LASVPVRLRPAVVPLNRPVTLSWNARQALLGRLQHVQETAHLRASFSDVYPAPAFQLRPGQRMALLRVLEAWAVDLDGPEPIPDELVDLRSALTADLNGSE